MPPAGRNRIPVVALSYAHQTVAERAIAETELTLEIGPPRPDRAVALEDDAVFGSGRPRRPIAVEADVRRATTILAVAEAELTLVVPPPTPKASRRA